MGPASGPAEYAGTRRNEQAWRREINASILTFVLAALLHAVGGLALLIYYWSRLQLWDRFVAAFIGLVLLPVSGLVAAVVTLLATRFTHRLLGHPVCPYCEAPLPILGECQCHAAREYRQTMRRLALEAKTATQGKTEK